MCTMSCCHDTSAMFTITTPWYGMLVYTCTTVLSPQLTKLVPDDVLAAHGKVGIAFAY